MHPHAGFGGGQVPERIRDHLKKLFNIEESSGIEIFVMLQGVAHLSRLLDAQQGDDREISGPRWRLLLRLLIEEELGNAAGITPTDLSRSQRVGKNTISALLRGLEAQHLIERTLDPVDLRAFRIRLTPAGRDYLVGNVPRRIENLNRLLSGLDRGEREELAMLLTKLHRSLLGQCPHLQDDPDMAIEPQGSAG